MTVIEHEKRFPDAFVVPMALALNRPGAFDCFAGARKDKFMPDILPGTGIKTRNDNNPKDCPGALDVSCEL